MVEVEVLNVRLPEEIITWCDDTVKQKVYRTKSEMIREILRDYVLEQKRSEYGQQKYQQK